jgi:hypothetical protein
MDLTGAGVGSTQKDSPLWIFPVADHLNNLRQIDLLEDKLREFNMTKDTSVTYPRTIHVKMLDPFELTESDAPGFIYLQSTMRVTLPYLLFREHSVTWPFIKGFSETLPLANSQRFTSVRTSSYTSDPVSPTGPMGQVDEPTTPPIAKASSTKNNDGSAKKFKATSKF